MSDQPGVLYVVATPIGNLEDISRRALRILAEADLIAAEDTRHSRRLLQHYGIDTPLQSYHDFNEEKTAERLLENLRAGRNVALISDAGTPLISDPGYRLVHAAHLAGLAVVPVPGPSALVAALSVAGLPTDRFVFEGYAPDKRVARKKRLQELSAEPRTIVFYETPHRIQAFLEDAVAVLGPDRPATLARELTKRFETVMQATLQVLLERVSGQEGQRKGEFVVVLRGAAQEERASTDESRRVLSVLLQELPLKQAAALAAKITGGKKNDLYQAGLALQESSAGQAGHPSGAGGQRRRGHGGAD